VRTYEITSLLFSYDKSNWNKWWAAVNTVMNRRIPSNAVAYPGIFFRGGVQQIQLRTERMGSLGVVTP